MMAPRTKLPALRLSSVTVSVHGRRVLEDLDLSVQAGQLVAIQGQSGGGKSTLLAAVAGLRRLDSGEVWFGDIRTDQLGDRARSANRLKRLGVVFQSDELLPELTLGENISLPLRMTGKPRKTEELLSAASDLLEELDILGLMDRMPTAVSGGQLQRASIARALIHDPDVVLADEPTAALDATAARSAIELLLRLARAQDTAVVVVTHDPVVASMCDRIAMLEEGRLFEAQPTIVNG